MHLCMFIQDIYSIYLKLCTLSMIAKFSISAEQTARNALREYNNFYAILFLFSSNQVLMHILY